MKQSKRGFTIVELVIVIAVIAVLAAVLIPTFSSLIKKANLSADMQAVREMNIALAADEALNGRPQDVDKVMQVLANAGYNTVNWKTLTAGYQVYWYKPDNKMVLYSTKEHVLVYPEDMDADMFGDIKHKNDFYVYNQNVKQAEELPAVIDIGSSTPGQSKTDFISSQTDTAKAAINSIDSAVTTNASLSSSLGITDAANIVYNGGTELKEEISAGTYASLYLAQVADKNAPVKYTSSGDIQANVAYISVATAANASAADILAAQKAAGELTYSMFVQINSDKQIQELSIVFPAGTVIDASAHEWKPVKTFSGYFGTDDPNNPVVINGAKLTEATGYTDTIAFDGSGGKYFVTGFFGCIYGDAVIENVTFRNMTMDQPAKNFNMANTTLKHSRNSIGVIGGVIDDPNADPGTSVTNVTVRNIVVEDNVTIHGVATAAGLIGYVGSSGDTSIVNKASTKRRLFNGLLTIENCRVSATVIGGPENEDYGPCAGIIGFLCRCQEEGDGDGKKGGFDGDANNGELYTVVIKNCVFDGKVTGYQGVGAAVGSVISGLVVFQGTNDFSGATLTSVDPAGSDMCGVIGHMTSAGAADMVVLMSTATAIEKGSLAAYGDLAGTKKVAELIDSDGRTASQKYDTLKKGTENIGGNDGIVTPKTAA